jgi:hypothetical protein
MNKIGRETLIKLAGNNQSTVRRWSARHFLSWISTQIWLPPISLRPANESLVPPSSYLRTESFLTHAFDLTLPPLKPTPSSLLLPTSLEHPLSSTELPVTPCVLPPPNSFSKHHPPSMATRRPRPCVHPYDSLKTSRFSFIPPG